MKKAFVFVLFGCALLSACSSTDKDSGVLSSSDRSNEWGEADISDLKDTKLSSRFKNAVNPVVYFDFNSSTLSVQALNALKGQVAWLHSNPNALIVIEGHCDERGTREYNLALSEKRASAVSDYFIANGINPKRIRVIAYGKERPAVFGSFETAWAKNRRAVTIVQ